MLLLTFVFPPTEAAAKENRDVKGDKGVVAIRITIRQSGAMHM